MPISTVTSAPVALKAVADFVAARCFGQEGKSLLFLKKKKQKDFAHWVLSALVAPEPNGRTFFNFFF